jgi:hypothetical protein
MEQVETLSHLAFAETFLERVIEFLRERAENGALIFSAGDPRNHSFLLFATSTWATLP